MKDTIHTLDHRQPVGGRETLRGPGRHPLALAWWFVRLWWRGAYHVKALHLHNHEDAQ